MNIFVLDRDPVLAAQLHSDTHVIKMAIEAAQLLCTAVVHHGGTAGYKPTHPNHPCALWARASSDNWLWLRDHALALCDEFQFRFGKIHKTRDVIDELEVDPIPDGAMTPFAQAMPDDCKHEDPVVAYRTYYARHKHGFWFGNKWRMASWRNRPVPDFMRNPPVLAGLRGIAA